MKNLLPAILFSILPFLANAETVKTIGNTHYGSQEHPFGMYFGYERSASLFSYSEIGTYCFITKLAWEVQAGNSEYCPVKIYLKQTTQTTLSAATWSTMKEGATLVYNAITSFPSSGWQILDIADFGYTTGNLLVLCETNYGPVPPLNYPWFWYSLTSSNRHEYWRVNDTALLANGSVNKFRPNIQLHYLNSSAHNPPSGFIATAAGPAQINLSWTKNSSNDNVMIACNTVNTFGIPSGSYVPGSMIAGGGTVIYLGSGTTFDHADGLLPGTTYFYKAWSVYSSPPSYSQGASASATTFCLAISSFPYLTDMESSQFPPSCWSLSSKPWISTTDAGGYGNGTASARADFFSIAVGNFDLVSPLLDISSLSDPMIRFDHAYATFNGKEDKLELWCSADSGATFLLHQTWLGGLTGPLNTGGESAGPFIPTSSQWGTKSCSLPPGTDRLFFRGVSAYGNNLYLDNIEFYENALFATWNGSVSDVWSNPQNWSPAGIPGSLHTVIIPVGTLFSPVADTPAIGIKHLTIQDGAVLTISGSSSITLSGDLTILPGATLNNSGIIYLGGHLKFPSLE